jgi:hypothetical protein
LSRFRYTSRPDPVQDRLVLRVEERDVSTEDRGALRFRAIDDAFRRGDLDALRQAVAEPDVIPNGDLGPAIGRCLVYAIFHSPRAFVRTLLDLGADPDAHAHDGFPPLIAALGMTRDAPGAPGRPDVDAIVRLLLAHGADPNQRGLNDYTPLHMAVAERNLLAVHRLLEAGADADLRTRIDECQTPLEMARAAGASEIVATLEQRGRPLRHRLRSGVVLLWDVPGMGAPLRRQQRYRVQLRHWLDDGRKPVRWVAASGPVGIAQLDDDGETLITEILVNRGQLMSGLFYGLDGMHVGGTRRLEIAPHMAYGERGVRGVIPPGASLVIEVTVLAAASADQPVAG